MRSTLNVFLNESLERHSRVYFGQNSSLIASLNLCTTAFMSTFHQNNSSHLRLGESMMNSPGLMNEERASAENTYPQSMPVTESAEKASEKVCLSTRKYSVPCWKLFTVKRAITGFSHFASLQNYLMRLLGTLVCGWQSLTPP